MMETPRECNLLHFIMKAAQSERSFHLSLTIFLSVLENDIHREFSTTRPYTALYLPDIAIIKDYDGFIYEKTRYIER